MSASRGSIRFFSLILYFARLFLDHFEKMSNDDAARSLISAHSLFRKIQFLFSHHTIYHAMFISTAMLNVRQYVYQRNEKQQQQQMRHQNRDTKSTEGMCCSYIIYMSASKYVNRENERFSSGMFSLRV